METNILIKNIINEIIEKNFSEIDIPKLSELIKNNNQSKLPIKQLIGKVHLNEPMFHDENYIRYFYIGISALKNIYSSLFYANLNTDSISNVLDFASGYGRVLRWLQYLFKNADITCSDINEEAVNFCKETFGVEGVISNSDFSKLNFNKKFDVIWIGSLLTHLNEENWYICLKRLKCFLKQNGILIFSTHGEDFINKLKAGKTYNRSPKQIKKAINDYNKFGFGFMARNIDPKYGLSVTTFNKVHSILLKVENLQLIRYTNSSWDRFQDVYSLKLT
ncbi:class I SAM-dependent methyltransferase [Candidatus Dependentiae bacterium]|nr:class I SAM-dependent methyltransferase [Candidatus Dependentiae bacterium]